MLLILFDTNLLGRSLESMGLSHCITFGSIYFFSAKVGKTSSFAKLDQYQQLMTFITETSATDAFCLEQLRMSGHVINKNKILFDLFHQSFLNNNIFTLDIPSSF